MDADTSRNSPCRHNYQISCGDCRLNTICLPLSLHSEEIDQLDDIVQRGRPLQKGQNIYHSGEEFTSVYALRSGTVKGFRITDDGKEQVTGFYLPGEIFGLEGISDSRYPSSAVALETASVCEIPFHRLEELSTKVPSLQRHVFKLMSKEITQDQQLITLLSKNSAEERIAAFLLSISTRNKQRHLSDSAFRLPMSRSDIGNFLGLTVETVSRIFTRLQKQEIIAVNNKDVELLNIVELQKIAGVA